MESSIRARDFDVANDPVATGIERHSYITNACRRRQVRL
jgi:hypothetical protein